MVMSDISNFDQRHGKCYVQMSNHVVHFLIFDEMSKCFDQCPFHKTVYWGNILLIKDKQMYFQF